MDTESICAQISGGVYQQAEDLMKIWNYVGYGPAEMERKMAALVKSCRAAFVDFIKAENDLVTEMNGKIEALRQRVSECCAALGLPPYFPALGLTSCQLLQDLTNKVAELEQEKVRRKEELRRLCCEIIKSSLQLGRDAGFIKQQLAAIQNIQATDVPSEGDISTLQAILAENNATLGPLISQMNALQSDIRRIAAEIAYEVKSPREKELLQVDEEAREGNSEGSMNGCEEMFNVDDEIKRIAGTMKGVLPNDADLEELKEMRLRLVKEKARLVGTCEELRSYLASMWNRLDKPADEQETFLRKCEGFTPQSLELLEVEADACRKERLQTIQTYLPVVRGELLDLARTCCLEEQETSKLVKLEASATVDGGKGLVDYLEHRIEELKVVFRQHRRVYEAIASFQLSFRALQQVEQRLKDPAILSNRGGILLKTEKEKKRLLKEVEKTEKEALAAIDEYETEKGKPFVLSNGKTFVQIVEEQRQQVVGSNRGSRASSAAGRRPNSGGHPGSPPC
uniref:Protein regulator of cytokinesis 1 n=2 Tax=Mesocestoides corti TaxID=53468 RepID=A0A5K3EPB9_MESCO